MKRIEYFAVYRFYDGDIFTARLRDTETGRLENPIVHRERVDSTILSVLNMIGSLCKNQSFTMFSEYIGTAFFQPMECLTRTYSDLMESWVATWNDTESEVNK